MYLSIKRLIKSFYYYVFWTFDSHNVLYVTMSLSKQCEDMWLGFSINYLLSGVKVFHQVLDLTVIVEKVCLLSRYSCFTILVLCFGWNVYSLLSTSFSLFHGSLFLTSTSSSLSILSCRPAGGQSTWTATACDLISHFLTGAKAYVTIKVFLSFPRLTPPFLSPFPLAQLCCSSVLYLHTVVCTDEYLHALPCV